MKLCHVYKSGFINAILNSIFRLDRKEGVLTSCSPPRRHCFQGWTNHVAGKYGPSAQTSPLKAMGPNGRKPQRVGGRPGPRLPGRLGTGLAGQRPLFSRRPERAPPRTAADPAPRGGGPRGLNTSGEFPAGKLQIRPNSETKRGPLGAGTSGRSDRDWGNFLRYHRQWARSS